MHRNPAFEWLQIAAATTSLGMESAAVIGLRITGAAMGGQEAEDEAWCMYLEKVIALCELQTRLFNGSLGATPTGAAKASLKHYHRKVAANRRRLTKSR